MQDLAVIMDTSGLERAALLASVDAAAVAALFAATFPERVSALILVSPQVRTAWAEDFPWGFAARGDAGVGCELGGALEHTGTERRADRSRGCVLNSARRPSRPSLRGQARSVHDDSRGAGGLRSRLDGDRCEGHLAVDPGAHGRPAPPRDRTGSRRERRDRPQRSRAPTRKSSPTRPSPSSRLATSTSSSARSPSIYASRAPRQSATGSSRRSCSPTSSVRPSTSPGSGTGPGGRSSLAMTTRCGSSSSGSAASKWTPRATGSLPGSTVPHAAFGVPRRSSSRCGHSGSRIRAGPAHRGGRARRGPDRGDSSAYRRPRR